MAADDSTRPRGRRLIFWIGLLMVVAGLAMIAYVCWEFFGTTVVSKHRQEQAGTAIQKAWDEGKPKARTKFGAASAIVEIPRFGDDYRIPVFEGTSDRALGAGFGHFEGTARPGAVGNFALAGHRVTHGEPLRNMPSLRAGDKIHVLTREKTYIYELTGDGDSLVVPFTSVWVTDPLPDNPEPGGEEPAQKKGQRLITLTTCSELFHTDNRMIAFGRLVSVRPAG